MAKCGCDTDGMPCSQEERAFFDKVHRRWVGTGLCFYHTKMSQGLILPFRQHEVTVKWNGVTINKR